ncbi:MAG: hypothetical protein WC184_12820 [Acidimicrobiia bacterium]
MDITTASNITDIHPDNIAAWLGNLEQVTDPDLWDTNTESMMLDLFVKTEPKIVAPGEPLPFEDDETADWQNDWMIIGGPFGDRLITRIPWNV